MTQPSLFDQPGLLPTLPGMAQGIVAMREGAGRRGRNEYDLQCQDCLEIETTDILVLMRYQFPRCQNREKRLCPECHKRVCDGKTYMAHRVSYEINVGKIPAGLEIDHKCRTRGCTKPSHLQAVTHAENMQNLSSRNPVSKAGYRGVSYNKRLKKWVASVRYRGEFYYLGLHSNPEDAAQAALDKRMELFTNNQEDRSEQIA